MNNGTEKDVRRELETRRARALERAADGLPADLRASIALWARAKTDPASRRSEGLQRDKAIAVGSFLAFCGRFPADVTPAHVAAWRAELERRQLAPGTVYKMIAAISSFFKWAAAIPGSGVYQNPVESVRPRAPKAYGKATRAIPREDVAKILWRIASEIDGGSVQAARDFAITLMLLESPLRRAEVIGLTGADVQTNNGGLVIRARRKGGDYESVRIDAPEVKAALLRYLQMSGRELGPDAPLWTRHDRAGEPGAPLSSHAYAKNLKGYARRAGVQPKTVHVHGLRHLRAQVIHETTGAIRDVQEALGHASDRTTRVYVHTIATKPDRHAGTVLRALFAEKAQADQNGRA